MDNCDLEKLSISVGKLDPPFKPSILNYKVLLPSGTEKITLDLLTSDSGASYRIIGEGGINVIEPKDGINLVQIEVTSEDGTLKKYVIEITKLSASIASLNGLKIAEDLQLVPPFDASVYEYACMVPFYVCTLNICPSVPDNQMKTTICGEDATKPVSLSTGDTVAEVQVFSADGTKSQEYRIIVTRLPFPSVISFKGVADQRDYECPISLTAFYRPVTIRGSDPKSIFSSPCIDFLVRRSKTDPLSETPLDGNWKVHEYELDKRMSGAAVQCTYAYRGCSGVLKLSELGLHVKDCTFKPPLDLDPKTITDAEWYKTEVTPTNVKSESKHMVQVRNWEKKLHQVFNDNDADKLCSHAVEQIKLYNQQLPAPGSTTGYDEGSSPLDALRQAAMNYATAIASKPKDPKLHFLLGQVLEEHYYAAEIYGLKEKQQDEAPRLSNAKATGRQEEILAICKLHGIQGRPTLEQQLKALDAEYQQLKDQGQSEKSDYIQTLFAWKSKQAGKEVKTTAAVTDEESPFGQALMKYLDALSLNIDNWQYNFHVGRLMLLHIRNKEALTYLQKALSLQPASAITRCYVGLALLEEENGPSNRMEEAVIYLQQGLEHLISQLFTQSEKTQQSLGTLHAENLFCLTNTHLLRGILKLGNLQRKLSVKPPIPIQTAENTLHIAADLAARALCFCQYRGAITEQLEWVLLEAHYGLLEVLMEEPKGKEHLIHKRCQALSALLRLTSIPACQELLDMQEKVCQKGVLAAPCNSHALYLLGLAQLAQYDNNPSVTNKDILRDAQLTFQASVSLENMPAVGPPKQEIMNQKWWQNWKAAEETKAQQKLQQSKKVEGSTTSAASTPARVVARGRATATKGSVAPKPAAAASTTSSTPARGAGARNIKGPSNTPFKGHGAAVPPVKPSKAVISKPTSGSCETATRSKQSTTPITDKLASPLLGQKLASSDETTATTPDLGQQLINRSSYVHHLGLARALSRTEELFGDAKHHYQEVIAMAPEVYDAYIELADLLVRHDPLAAVDVYCRFPLKPVQDQTFDDAFITGEIVQLLIKLGKYDDPRLAPNMVAYGKVMGIACLEKYMSILEENFKTELLKTVYAGIHNKCIDDPDLQNFFHFKCWI